MTKGMKKETRKVHTITHTPKSKAHIAKYLVNGRPNKVSDGDQVRVGVICDVHESVASDPQSRLRPNQNHTH